MAKVPRRPSLQRLQELEPERKVLPAGSRVWRVYYRGGRHPTTWSAFRYVGPTQGRFDHHVPGQAGQLIEQEYGVLYAALDINTCLAEVFQKTRRIDRSRGEPWLVAFDLNTPVSPLDLTSSFATRVGASMGLMSGPRSVGRNWARGFFDAYPSLHGLYYPSSMYANAPAIVFTERAEKAGVMPRRPSFHRALDDAVILTVLRNAARTIGYGLG